MTEHGTAPLDMSGRRDADGGYELRFVGEIDLSTLPTIEDRIQGVLAASPSRVALDLSGVTFMDSSGIGMLLDVAGAVPDVTLVNPSPAVARLVELCGLAAFLPVTA